MNRYLELLTKVFEAVPDRLAAVDGDGMMSYGEWDLESARVYRYLKDNHIGKEDFVYIIMPKNRHLLSCILGVWKAGAAFVMNEPDYPKERVDYIREDIGARLMLDMDLFRRIQSENTPLPGHEETELHDAAFAVYTSGSTGRPKGVLHEYGNLDRIGSFAEPESIFPERRHGLVSPTSFIAFTLFLVPHSLMGRTFYMVSGELLRNLPALCEFIEENRLNEIYLPPSYIRIYNQPAPTLDLIFTGSEPANGLYYAGGRPRIRNIYSMSEAGFFVLTGILDRAYDEAPVGEPGVRGLDIVLLDDNGGVIEGPGMGELCFQNEYVRGYINLPEKTERAFVNGVFHTGDLCRRDENGVYYVAGRKDDMFKINGNRIEPAEIEAAVLRLTGLKKVIAKGFNESHHQYICVYYLEDEAKVLGLYSEGELIFHREKLTEILPSYMIPSYYIPLKEFPLNINGKIAKNELKKPDISGHSEGGAPPENEGEAYFCQAMQRLLGLPFVGRDDDFFVIGGDSIKAIQLVQNCGEYALAVKDIYAHRTPALLAKNVKKKESGGAFDYSKRLSAGYCEENLSGAAFFGSFVNNVTTRTGITLKDKADIPRLEKALISVYSNYPFFRQHLEVRDERLFYVRDEDPPHIYLPSETVEKEDRIRVIADGDTLEVRIPHAFTDGFGMKLFLQLFLGTYADLLRGREPIVQAKPIYCPGHYYDIFSEDYSAFGGEVPEVYKDFTDVFLLPDEIGKDDTGKRFHYTVEIPKDRLQAFPGENADGLSAVGGEATAVIGDMVARAIRDVYPEAQKVGCRTSVNLRSLFHQEESLKNMSFALAVFLPGRDSVKQLKESLRPEVLKWQLMKFRQRIEGRLQDPQDNRLVDAIISPTFAITNVADNGKGYPDIVASVTEENPSPVPLLVMIQSEGEYIRVSFVQKFEDRSCFDAFSEYSERQ